MHIAIVKKPTSRRKGMRSTLKGRMMHMDPATQETIKEAAPSSSPIASPPEFARMAEKVAKTSGLAFPKARSVTPATSSFNPRIWAIAARFGVKKSEADMPSVEKRNMSQSRSAVNVSGRTEGTAQKYSCRYGMERTVSDDGHRYWTWVHCSAASWMSSGRH